MTSWNWLSYFDQPDTSGKTPRSARSAREAPLSARSLVSTDDGLELEMQDEECAEEDDIDSADEDEHKAGPMPLDEDTFGMSVCALTRDTHFMAKHGPSWNRFVRLFVTLLLAVMTVYIQIELLKKVKQFVSARAVHDIRISYSEFQNAMYDCELIPTNCYKTQNGGWRGNSKNLFPPKDIAWNKLKAMGEHEQDEVCRIPLSQPYFFGIILFIWVLTCVNELRKACWLMFYISMLKTESSMAHAFVHSPDGDTGVIITGMTSFIKVVVFFLMFLPRAGITLFLMWCGCRWLLATNNFADLILNAVALEFILMIKDIMFSALTPIRNKMDLGFTFIQPYPANWSSSTWSFLSTTLMLPFWMLMVFLYMRYWQQVLPGYNWDVKQVCEEYIKVRYAV